MPVTLTGSTASLTDRTAPSITAPAGTDAPSAASVVTPLQALLDLAGKLKASAGLLGLASTWTAFQTFSAGLAAATIESTGLLQADGTVAVDAAGTNNGTLSTAALRIGGDTSGEAIGSKRTAGGRQFGLDFYTGSARRGGISNTGVWDVNPGAVTIPALATGGTGSGRQKLGWWIDAQGNLYVHGYVNGLSLTAGGQAQVWANGTLPSPFNGSFAISRPCVGSTAGGFQGIGYAFISNGGLIVGAAHHETDTFAGIEVNIVMNPNLAIAP